MKIIHSADIHLDSKMETNLDKEKATERKNELLITFEKMVEYAKINNIDAIIIAGDLFDKSKVSAKAKKIVINAILSAPNIDFIYLRGNHDEAIFWEDDIKFKNLKTFRNDKWVKYEYNNVVISGIELGNKNDYEIYNSLILDKNKTNIVVMHGQESENDVKDKTEIINLKQLKNKNIDYLALGHIHKYKKEKLDNRGIYCYSGCLEPRGFDECGEKGFVVIDINDNEIQTEFIKFNLRQFYEVNVDITDLSEIHEIENKIIENIKFIPKTSFVKIILIGEIEIGQEIDIKYLLKKFNQDFYFLKIYDKLKFKIDVMKYKYDVSLKGEFIRLVLKQQLTDEEKNKIISTGIRALSGEEL